MSWDTDGYRTSHGRGKEKKREKNEASDLDGAEQGRMERERERSVGGVIDEMCFIFLIILSEQRRQKAGLMPARPL